MTREPYKKSTTNMYIFVVIAAIIASDNPFCFRKHLSKRI